MVLRVEYFLIGSVLIPTLRIVDMVDRTHDARSLAVHHHHMQPAILWLLVLSCLTSSLRAEGWKSKAVEILAIEASTPHHHSNLFDLV
jgi:hypothetical protein